jgi:hypothetical protein
MPNLTTLTTSTPGGFYQQLNKCFLHSMANLNGGKNLSPEGKLLVTKFEFGGSFGMSLEGDCHEIEVILNLELLVTFGMSLE